MAVTLLSLIPRNPATTHEQFVWHYEHVHMPLLRECFGDTMPKMKRTYVNSTAPTIRGSAVPADLVLEMTFEDHAHMDRMQARWGEGDVQKRIMEDEKVYCAAEGERTVVVTGVQES